MLALALICIAVAALLQLPIAWMLTYRAQLTEPAWSYAYLLVPASKQSDTETIQVSWCTYLGLRAVEVIARAPHDAPRARLEPSCVSPDSPVIRNACEPWALDELHPALVDASAWPDRTGVYSRPNMMHSEQLAFRVTSGWPWHCFEGQVNYDRSTRTDSYVGIVSDARFRPWPSPVAYFCYQPRWPALLANTGIHAAILAALGLLASFTFRTIRARSRRSRNLCPTCAYDLQHTPRGRPCPECGTPCPSSSPSGRLHP